MKMMRGLMERTVMTVMLRRVRGDDARRGCRGGWCSDDVGRGEGG